VFGPFGRPAHVAGSPAPAVGAAHQMLPIRKTLPIGQMLPIGKTLSIGQMLLIRKMLPILPAPGICASPILPAPGICASAHDISLNFKHIEAPAPFNWIWKAKITKKLKIFVWLVF
jgi:hypothetical protein